MTEQLIILTVLAGLTLIVCILAVAALITRQMMKSGRQHDGAPAPFRHPLPDERGRAARHMETPDKLAVLRSPYKPRPLCNRCIVVGRIGIPRMYRCRMDALCGLNAEEHVH